MSLEENLQAIRHCRCWLLEKYAAQSQLEGARGDYQFDQKVASICGHLRMCRCSGRTWIVVLLTVVFTVALRVFEVFLRHRCSQFGGPYCMYWYGNDELLY